MIEERKKELLNRLVEINEITKRKDEYSPSVGEIIMLLHEFGEILKIDNAQFNIEQYSRQCKYYYLIKKEIDTMININTDFQEYINSSDIVNRNFRLLYKNCIRGSLPMPSNIIDINDQRVTLGHLFDDAYKIRITEETESLENFEEYAFLSEKVQKLKHYYGQKILANNKSIFVNNTTLSTVIIAENMFRLIEQGYTKGDISTVMKHKQRILALKK